jgi:hypothetical protein
MHSRCIAGLVIAIPVILFPVAFAWYLNIGGMVTAIRQARARRTARQKHSGSVPGAR